MIFDQNHAGTFFAGDFILEARSRGCLPRETPLLAAQSNLEQLLDS